MLCGLFFHIIKTDNDSSKDNRHRGAKVEVSRSDTTDRVQNRLFQTVPFGHEEIQKKLFTSPRPSAAEIHIEKRTCTIKRAVTRDNF